MGLKELKYAPLTEADYFAAWCEANLEHSVDVWEGDPVKWEKWQFNFFEEALACEDDGAPFWRTIGLIVPRKNGKTLALAALALYKLIEDAGQPEILLAAASDKQAGRLFDAVVSFLRRNHDLDDLVHRREYVGEIVNIETGGKIIRMPSSGETLDGFNPSLAICDELHAWNTPTRRRVWTAMTTGGGARRKTQVITITTAGEASQRSSSILGRLIDGNEASGDVERHPGLTISRNWQGRTLLYNYSAPTGDPTDVEAMKLANPASWIDRDFLVRQSSDPAHSKGTVLQMHGCVWAESVEAWVSMNQWEACREPDAEIPAGAEVAVGVDIGITHDSTAVAVAHVRDDGRIHVQATVWSAVERVMADVLVPGGAMDLSLIEEHIMHLAERYSVIEVAYDPRFFERSAQLLAGDLVMVPMHQQSGPMADAYQEWYASILERRLVHSGQAVLTAHVMATAAQQTERGWRVSKIRQNQRIDALVASAIAVYRAVMHSQHGSGVVFG